ncbi:unnamed protein product [Lathyrus oleraceus]|uniref:ABC1 atypical kinase-like domain-containing protein n=1 Tax=Pisum sativum TaxID=3888 RepID=A0A9D5AZY7_PEA|nr:probable anion transporter 5 [Pisum sativum]KAI5424719.1 hypothetical protein KIW84_030779 [Pisum sativum]
MIEQELGLFLVDIFSEISPEPVAAASLGQVYQTRLRRTGQVVAIKVERPGVQASGMYLGASVGMLFLPSLVKVKGPQSVFIAEAFLGSAWSLLWFGYASDPKASALGAGGLLLPVNKKMDRKVSDVNVETGVERNGVKKNEVGFPWMKIMTSLPVWAIVVNNFTFHYALYMLMNWLPTYFELGLKLSLHEMGSSKMQPWQLGHL